MADPALATAQPLDCDACGFSSPANEWDWLSAETPLAKRDRWHETGLEEEALWDQDGSLFLRGSVLEAKGVSGLVKGSVLLEFSPVEIVIRLENSGRKSHVAYTEVTSLEFAGRGRHDVTSNFQVVGGGFGLKGAAKGIVEAEAINAIVRRLTRRSAIETLVGLSWTEGSLVLFTNRIVPEALAQRCASIIDLIESAQNSKFVSVSPVDQNDLVRQIRELAELRDQGVLTDEEFAAAKTKLLG